MKLAIIAHDGKKPEMVRFLTNHIAFLKRNDVKLVATGTTGIQVEHAGLKVEKVYSGSRGRCTNRSYGNRGDY